MTRPIQTTAPRQRRPIPPLRRPPHATTPSSTPRVLQALPAMALSALLLAGCAAVGPNYAGPPVVAKAATDRPAFERSRVSPVNDAPPPSRWWEAIGDPILTRLVDDAFAASPTLQSAEARVRSARAQQAVNRAALGPTGGAGGRYVRGRVPTGSLLGSSSGSGSGSSSGGSGSSSSIPNPIRLNSYTVDADATWEIDLFGGKRRGLESATAAAESSQAALEDAQVRLAGDVGQAYAQLREAQDRLALASRTVELRSRMLSLTLQRQAGGTASQGDVARADADLAQARAELPGIATTVDQQLDQLAILAGREPGAYDALLAVPAASWVEPPLPPDTVPVGTPADWLRRRPDIRQAERMLASRNATIGQNVADLFPSVSILGLIAGTGTHVNALFRTAPIWLATPSLTWNFLDIPSTRAKIRGAEADRDKSIADYQRTVLEALQDANDSLSRFGRGREALLERGASRDAAARAASITRERYAAGTASLGDALDAVRQRMQADDAWVQAAATYLTAYVSLQKSLGLGWGPSPASDGMATVQDSGGRQGDRVASTTATSLVALPMDAATSSPGADHLQAERRVSKDSAGVNRGSVATTASGRSAFATGVSVPDRPRGLAEPDGAHGGSARRRVDGAGTGGGGGGNGGDNGMGSGMGSNAMGNAGTHAGGSSGTSTMGGGGAGSGSSNSGGRTGSNSGSGMSGAGGNSGGSSSRGTTGGGTGGTGSGGSSGSGGSGGSGGSSGSGGNSGSGGSSGGSGSGGSGGSGGGGSGGSGSGSS